MIENKQSLSVSLRAIIPNDFYDTLKNLDTEQKLFDFFVKKQDYVFSFLITSESLERANEFRDDIFEYFRRITNGLIFHVDFQEDLPKLINIIKLKDNNEINNVMEFLLCIEIALKLSSVFKEEGESTFMLSSSAYEVSVVESDKKLYHVQVIITNNGYFTKDEQKEILVHKHRSYLINKKSNSPKKKRSPLDHRLRHEVFKRDNYKCKDCGLSKEQTTLHVDHIISVSQGGSDELNNLQTLCQACNLAKSSKCWKSGEQ